MTQHYVDPFSVRIPADTHVSQLKKRCVKEDGQIVPVLVTTLDDGSFVAADPWQAETVKVIRELCWPAMLVETEWTPGDLV